MRRRVVCGLSETIATFAPESAFTSVDLPTFGRPATATKPLLTATAAPHRGGEHPASLAVDGIAEPVACPCRACAGVWRLCADSLGQVPRVGQQVGGRVRG